MKRLNLVLLFLIFLFPASLQARKIEFNLDFTGKAGMGYPLIDRLDNGINKTGLNLGTGIKFTFPRLINNHTLATSTEIDESIYFGTAQVLGLGQYFHYRFLSNIAGRSIDAGIGAGPFVFFAPTRDSDSIWYGYSLKIDILTKIKDELWGGLYIGFQQLVMSKVKDPAFFTVGITLSWRLWSSSPAPTRNSEPAAKQSPIKQNESVKTKSTENKSISPEDKDGDKVPNDRDLCPSTKGGRQVNENGCRSIADGMIFSDLKFGKNSTRLNPAGETELTRLAEILKANKTIHLIIVIHSTNSLQAKKRGDLIEFKLKQLQIDPKRLRVKVNETDEEKIFFNFRLGL
ncbi:MAG: hypothetical protein PF689_12965 [Deltaproteobacteria bacterium]|jgi:outer membrane protein OmpA-like peptidoglycan-associated protein|nr:hypothetical protein [Deltaproteobacteria bacterium]